MDPIWKNLPDDLAFLVISFLNIDTRLSFKVPPNRLKFRQVVNRFGREQLVVKGKNSRFTFRWRGGSYPSLLQRTPTFDVIIHARGGRAEDGIWIMYVVNKNNTAGKMTYYSHDTAETNEYTIVRNGGGWDTFVV